MANQDTWRKMMKEERLKHQLEVQSRQIEKVFNHHQLSAQVSGGQVQPRQIRFDLHAQLETGVELLKRLKADLLAVLGATLIQDDGGWSINVSRSDDVPVALLDLVPMLDDVPPVTAVLGLSEDGNPVICELNDIDVPHVLISGQKGAGKSSLIRTMATSLAMSNRQHQCQLVILAPQIEPNTENKLLAPLELLPHMIFPIAWEVQESLSTLDFLVDEFAYRLEQNMKTPSIVIMIDELVHLLAEGGQTANDLLLPLLHKGPSVGIHLILATEEPQSPLLTQPIRATVPLRLVGQMGSEAQAKAGAGIGGTQAEYLLGDGDFLAVVEDTSVHFQAAAIGDYDLHLTLDMLQRTRPRPLIAQPYDPQIKTKPEQSGQEKFYWFNESVFT